jgi:hypothetical protein
LFAKSTVKISLTTLVVFEEYSQRECDSIGASTKYLAC